MRTVLGITGPVAISLAFLYGLDVLGLNSNVSVCLNMGTKLEAGILVTDGDLIAAALACERATENPGNGISLMKVAVARGAIQEEIRRRASR